MVRVNGHDSQAFIVTVDTEADGAVGMLFIDLEAPASEIGQWKTGQPIHLEAKWKPKYILFPIHPTLIRILSSCSVQGSFVAHAHIIHNRLYIFLQSAGELKPLDCDGKLDVPS